MRDKWPVSGGHCPWQWDVITDLRKSAIKTQKVTTTDNQLLMIKNLLTTNPSNSVGISDYRASLAGGAGCRCAAHPAARGTGCRCAAHPAAREAGCRCASCSPAGRRDVAPFDRGGHRRGPVRHAKLAKH